MNLIKNFRKPYLTIILASLTLFASCSQYENEVEEIPNSTELANRINKLNLADYVEKHLQISNDIYILLENENNIDIEFLESAPDKLKLNEILGMLENANVQQSGLISDLFIQMYHNTLDFTNSNPDLKNLNYSEFENMITVEIDKQLDENYSNRSTGDCRATLDKAKARCGRNMVISLAVAGGVGIFTGGVGYAFGAGAAILVASLCAEDANNDYKDCMRNN
ncbi:hypothetical protein [Lacinutrix undariae]